jgi:hypothetical protein
MPCSNCQAASCSCVGQHGTAALLASCILPHVLPPTRCVCVPTPPTTPVLCQAYQRLVVILWSYYDYHLYHSSVKYTPGIGSWSGSPQSGVPCRRSDPWQWLLQTGCIAGTGDRPQPWGWARGVQKSELVMSGLPGCLAGHLQSGS